MFTDLILRKLVQVQYDAFKYTFTSNAPHSLVCTSNTIFKCALGCMTNLQFLHVIFPRCIIRKEQTNRTSKYQTQPLVNAYVAEHEIKLCPLHFLSEFIVSVSYKAELFITPKLYYQNEAKLEKKGTERKMYLENVRWPLFIYILLKSAALHRVFSARL